MATPVKDIGRCRPERRRYKIGDCFTAYEVSCDLCSNNERLDRHDQTAHTKRFFLCTKRKESIWKEDYLHRNQ